MLIILLDFYGMCKLSGIGIKRSQLFHELSHMVLEYFILGHPDDDHKFLKNWEIVDRLTLTYENLE
jgi:hypothetical protein